MRVLFGAAVVAILPIVISYSNQIADDEERQRFFGRWAGWSLSRPFVRILRRPGDRDGVGLLSALTNSR